VPLSWPAATLTAGTLHDLGYNAVIWPVTLLRAAMGATEQVLATLRDTDTQEQHLPAMQTRSRLYDLIRCESYAAFDASIGRLRREPRAARRVRVTNAVA
jgi:methylisocitrate lyase